MELNGKLSMGMPLPGTVHCCIRYPVRGLSGEGGSVQREREDMGMVEA